MTAQYPLHPDDREALLDIRRYLIGFRKTNGWNQQQLSQMIKGNDGMVYDLESNENWQWRLSRLQCWHKPFGLRLDARLWLPDAHLGQQVHEHPEVAPMYALSRKPGAWDMWQRIYLTSALRVARQVLGISAEDMAAGLGITRKAVWGWEATADELMLPKVLHYARSLGGRIELGWEKDE